MTPTHDVTDAARRRVAAKLAEAIHRGDDAAGVGLLSEWGRLTVPALGQDDKHPAWPCRLPGEWAKPGSNAQTGKSERG